MKAWADAVEWLDLHCPECRSIADRIGRSESLLDDEKHQIEHHVMRTRAVVRSRRRVPRAMRTSVKDPILIRGPSRRGKESSVVATRSQ
jgi:hypothetical protein